jgi:hypothetical protein
MANETAYPLYWPQSQPRTKSGHRSSEAPFSTGETYQKLERRYVEGQLREETTQRRRSKAVSVSLAVERLEDQLTRLEAQHPVLSTNLELRLNGQPRAGQKDPEDSGAAVYFTLKGKRTVLACDKWVRVADNIAALAAHIRAIRSVENYGVGTLEQAFRGYQAIEDYTSGIPWRRILGYKDAEHPDLMEVEKRFRLRARDVHPDMTGESHLQMAQLNQAMSEARKELAT